MKYETRLPRSEIAFRVGYDLTGQTSDGAASTIVWSGDLVESEARETDIWYTQTDRFQAAGRTVSIWFSGSQASGTAAYRISLDEVKVEKILP